MLTTNLNKKFKPPGRQELQDAQLQDSTGLPRGPEAKIVSSHIHISYSIIVSYISYVTFHHGPDFNFLLLNANKLSFGEHWPWSILKLKLYK